MLQLSGDGGIKTSSSSDAEVSSSPDGQNLSEVGGDRLPSLNRNIKEVDSERVGDADVDPSELVLTDGSNALILVMNIPLLVLVSPSPP